MLLLAWLAVPWATCWMVVVTWPVAVPDCSAAEASCSLAVGDLGRTVGDLADEVAQTARHACKGSACFLQMSDDGVEGAGHLADFIPTLDA